MALSFFCNNGFLGVCQKVMSKGELGPSVWDTSCMFMLITWACVLCSASWWALVTSGLCYGGVCIFLGYRVFRLRLKTTKAYSRGPLLAACTSDARYRSLQSKSYFLTRELKFSQCADILGSVQKDSHEGTSLYLLFFFPRAERKCSCLCWLAKVLTCTLTLISKYIWKLFCYFLSISNSTHQTVSDSVRNSPYFSQAIQCSHDSHTILINLQHATVQARATPCL